jgi:hypothetical protein
MKTLYNHQIEAKDLILANKKGIIHLPTGTGKSEIIFSSIIEKINRGEKVIVICSPRIILSNQIVNDVYEALIASKKNAKYLCVRSGEQVTVKGPKYNPNIDADIDNDDYDEDLFWETKYDWDIKQTTTPKVIGDEYAIAKSQNLPLIISCVYDSCHRIREAELDRGKFVESIFYDEAHNLCSKEFSQILNWYSEINAYSFTATLKKTPSDGGYGMNNVAKFGPVLYAKSAAEMITAGIIVRPRIHVIHPHNDILAERDKLPRNLIINAFLEHKKQLKTEYPTQIGAKLLVVCNGTVQLKDLFYSLINPDGDNKKHPFLNNIAVYAVGSGIGEGDGVGGCWKVRAGEDGINFNMSRKLWLKDLKELKPEEDAIIFHINILTEGIDVPGITGILPLKSLKLAKFLQNVGRATRLTLIDRERMRKGELSTEFQPGFEAGKKLSPQAKIYQKPYAWIIIPWLSQLDTDLESQFRDYIKNLRDFGFFPSEDILEQRSGAENEAEAPDPQNGGKGIYAPFDGKLKFLVSEGTIVKEGDSIAQIIANFGDMIIKAVVKGKVFFRVRDGEIKKDKLIIVINEDNPELIGGFGKFLHEIECEEEANKFYTAITKKEYEILQEDAPQTPSRLSEKMNSAMDI